MTGQKSYPTTSEMIEELAKENPKFAEAVEEEKAHIRLARFMREVRMSEHLTQTQLSKLLGMSQSEISRLESGAFEDRGPGVLVLARWAHSQGYSFKLSVERRTSDNSGVGDAHTVEL